MVCLDMQYRPHKLTVRAAATRRQTRKCARIGSSSGKTESERSQSYRRISRSLRRTETMCAFQTVESLLRSDNAKSSKRVMDKSKLPLTARVIELNPEMPTAWSYRRRLLLHVLAGVQYVTCWALAGKTSSSSSVMYRDSTESQQILSQDILLTLQALRQNPKNYSVWEHRKWLLRTMPQPDWRFELGLVNKFLEADARNCSSACSAMVLC